MRAKYKKRRKEAGTREDSTMAKLAAFTSTIRTTKKREEQKDKVEEKVIQTGVHMTMTSSDRIFFLFWPKYWIRYVERTLRKTRYLR